MYVKEIIDSVKSEFYLVTPNTNEIISAINTVIRDININVQQIKEISQVFLENVGVLTIDNQSTVTIDLIDDITINDSGEMNVVNNNGDNISGNNYSYIYDSESFSVTLPNSIVGVLDIILDNVILEHRDYEYIKNCDSIDEIYYCAIGNIVYFSSDIQSEGTANGGLKIIAKLNFPIIQDEEEDYNYFPANAFQLFVSGAVYMLTSRPKYRDDTRIAIHSKIYNEARSNIVYTLTHLLPNKEYTKQFKW